jgi:P27 family predicted phage terminase small subunit
MKSTPFIVETMPKPPQKLSPAARKLWNRLLNDLDVVDEAKLLMVSLLVESYDRRQEARAEIARSGAVVKDRWNQAKASPWMAIERDSSLAMLRAYHALGFDAVAVGDVIDRRAKLKPGEIDRIEQLLA